MGREDLAPEPPTLVKDVKRVEDTCGCPRSRVGEGEEGVFPESPAPRGGGRLVGTHRELSHCAQRDCFSSGYPRVRKYRLLCICKQSLKGRGANKNSQLQAIQVCEGRFLNREAIAHCSGSARPEILFSFLILKRGPQR